MKILKTKKMVTVKKFSAVWCGPCRALSPVIKEIKESYISNSNVKFEEYDVDEFNEETQKYGITSVPTIIIEKNGEVIERFTGLSSKLAYVNAINESLK
jgi:thioredoxin 1